jgi:DNA-3-methyladenine glycosylase II
VAIRQLKITTVKPSYALAAVRHLKRVDPVLARIIKEVGPISIRVSRRRFQALARAIIFQQLAGSAATAIYLRFVNLFPGRSFPTPAQVLALSDEQMRQAGLSRQKSLYLRDLAAHVANKSLNFHRFAAMSDEEIITELIRVKGIGRWSAEMFLMFNLGRPDVLPLDDLGLRSAARKAYGLAALPTKRELEQVGERWRPYRTVASWYLWQSTRIVLPRMGPRLRPRQTENGIRGLILSGKLSLGRNPIASSVRSLLRGSL